MFVNLSPGVNKPSFIPDSLRVCWLCTWLFSNHSSNLAGSSWGSRPADTATLGACQQRLPVVLAGPAVTGMLLRHVLLCGSFQVQLLQTSTLHLLHQLIQRTQLEDKFTCAYTEKEEIHKMFKLCLDYYYLIRHTIYHKQPSSFTSTD